MVPHEAIVRAPKEVTKNSLGSRLRKARIRAGLSLKAAGPVLGVNYSHLSKIENDLARPSAELLARLIARYEIRNSESVYAAAGVFPPDVERILAARAIDAYALLRVHLSTNE